MSKKKEILEYSSTEKNKIGLCPAQECSPSKRGAPVLGGIGAK
jgi:hypothetical protein